MTDDQRTFLGYVQAASERLCRDFDDYRDALRMQLGALKFEAGCVPLVDVMGAVAGTADESIDMACEVPNHVLLDELDAGRLGASIHRVTLAAQKLHRSGHPVTVRVSPRGSHHEVTVSFSGITPAAADMRVLEGSAVEGPGSARRSVARAFGLGVAMSHQFLRSCGSNIRLECSAGSEGAFVISIPTTQVDSPSVQAA